MILDTLKNLDETRGEEIEQWFGKKRQEKRPFFYTSVDLRHSGLRLAPVDTNLYPAGFNNLSPAGTARAARFARGYLEDRYPEAKRAIIIPENHTRNLYYLDNLVALHGILTAAGIEAQFGSLVAEAPIELESLSKHKLVEYPLKREGEVLSLANGFTPDVIIMNNDMTSGAPEILRGIRQRALPPVSMGWWQRRKSVHFAEYDALAQEFAVQFTIDPWLLSAGFHRCGLVDFKEKAGLDCLANGVEKVLSRAREKHKEYGITEDPYVFIKAESGTYGMGIMTVRAPEDIFELNKKDRNKMQTIKEGVHVSEVIIQEGIPTIDRISEKVAEPMIYMVDGIPTGGMWRVNGTRDALTNLNASGMEFAGMCDQSEDDCGKWSAVQDCHFRSFGIVAAIAALAAAREDYTVGKGGEGI